MTVRLGGSGSPDAGRLEMYREGLWAAVQPGATPNATHLVELVCQALGYTGGFMWDTNVYEAREALPVWQSLTCAEGSTSLFQCTVDASWTVGDSHLTAACSNDVTGELLAGACLVGLARQASKVPGESGAAS